jgi:hypothetical protein
VSGPLHRESGCLVSKIGTRGDFHNQVAVMACVYQTWQTSDDSSATADSFPPTQALHKEEERQATGGRGVGVRGADGRAVPPGTAASRVPAAAAVHVAPPGDDAGLCLQMRPHSRDGRLVLEGMAV